MFEKICLKTKESSNHQLDIGFLAESLLFYQKVILVGHKEEIITLLNFFGEENLEEILSSGLLELFIKENHIGSAAYPIGNSKGYNVNIFSGTKNGKAADILYQAHRELYKNSNANNKFINRFSSLVKPFIYPDELVEQIRSDFSDSKYFLDATDIYIKSLAPNISIGENQTMEIIKDKSFGPFDAYSFNSTLDLDIISKQIKEANPLINYSINYESVILSLAEARGDIFIASQFESEIATREINAKLIEYKFDEIYRKRTGSEEKIDSFYEYQLKDFNTIGEAFNGGIKNSKDLLRLLEKADKFKGWLKEIPDDKDLVREYYKEISADSWIEKLPPKTIRFLFFNALGLATDIFIPTGLGTIIGTSIGAADSLILDKWLKGWKPNQFVDKNLKPILKK